MTFGSMAHHSQNQQAEDSGSVGEKRLTEKTAFFCCVPHRVMATYTLVT